MRNPKSELKPFSFPILCECVKNAPNHRMKRGNLWECSLIICPNYCERECCMHTNKTISFTCEAALHQPLWRYDRYNVTWALCLCVSVEKISIFSWAWKYKFSPCDSNGTERNEKSKFQIQSVVKHTCRAQRREEREKTPSSINGVLNYVVCVCIVEKNKSLLAHVMAAPVFWGKSKHTLPSLNELYQMPRKLRVK